MSGRGDEYTQQIKLRILSLEIAEKCQYLDSTGSTEWLYPVVVSDYIWNHILRWQFSKFSKFPLHSQGKTNCLHPPEVWFKPIGQAPPFIIVVLYSIDVLVSRQSPFPDTVSFEPGEIKLCRSSKGYLLVLPILSRLQAVRIALSKCNKLDGFAVLCAGHVAQYDTSVAHTFTNTSVNDEPLLLMCV